MNELTSIELLYESLVPVEKPGSMFLSVGTVTLLSDKELHLDFNNTLTAWFPLENAHVKLCTQLTDFEPRTFNEDYIRQGITAQDLNYCFFADRLYDTYVTEVYTEYYSGTPENYLPVTLKRIRLLFADGSFLDYSDRISIFALAELAEVMK